MLFKTIIGLALLVIGVSSFLTFYASVRRTDTVIDISLKLQPGEKYEPYMNGTYHHTRVISKSALAGEVIVKEGSISFTANGFNTENNKNVIVSQRYSFLINPADDLYTFSFVNTEDKVLSSIRFILKEIWIDFFRLIPAFISLLITVPT